MSLEHLHELAQEVHDLQEAAKGSVDRDSPDGSHTGVNARLFPALPQDRREVPTATVNSGSPNGDRGADLAFLAGIWTHFSHRVLLNA